MSNTDESRKDFESWIRQEFTPEVIDRALQKGGSDSYAETMTHWYWKAWQASRTKPIAMPIIYTVDNCQYYYKADIQEAIEAAGYRCE